jgi:non-specific serine/threonine protein kinase
VDGLGRLVDKSLLKAKTDFDGRTRWHMLETIRQYGLELPQQSEELDVTMAASTDHHLRLAEEAASRAESADWHVWLDRLDAEHENVLAALTWAREREDTCLPALVVALGWYWQRRGDPSEGRRWLEVARGAATDDRSVLSILRWSTSLAAHENDILAATTHAERALEMAERLGDRIQSADARLALGNLVFFQQEAPDWSTIATTHYQAAMELYEEAGLTFRHIAAQLNLSLLDLATGDVASGRAHALLAEERARAGGWPHWQWRARIRLGIAAFLDGDDDEAERHLADCVRYDASNPEFGSRLQVVLHWLATVAARRDELDRSAFLAGAASRVQARTAVDSFMPRSLTAILAEWQDRVRLGLGDASYEHQAEAGRRLSIHEVRRLALRDQRPMSRPTSLSRRELQIVELVADGLTNREVSARLHLSPRTVDAHLDHVRNKLGLRTRAQMVRWLVESKQAGGEAEHEGMLGEIDPSPAEFESS